MVKTWVSTCSSKQEELKNPCLIAVHQWNCKLWPLIHMTSKQLFAITGMCNQWFFDFVCHYEGE